MDSSEQKRLAGGFLFRNQTDAKLAETERKKIEYLEAKLDYSKPEDILYIYNKTIEEQVFKTPVGIRYLKQLQEYLLSQEKIKPEQVTAIPLENTYDKAKRPRDDRKEQQEQEREAKKRYLTISVILNILLVTAVIAMFVISFNSDQPNILNYKKAITNQYAAWDQELTERERVVREKERALQIEAEDAKDAVEDAAEAENGTGSDR